MVQAYCFISTYGKRYDDRRDLVTLSIFGVNMVTSSLRYVDISDLLSSFMIRRVSHLMFIIS